MMRKIGLALMILGLALVGSALWLYQANQAEEEQAAQAVEILIPQVVQQIAERQEAQSTEPKETWPSFLPPPTEDPNREMPETVIDGYRYIGYLAIPTLELELPIMGDWTYPQLQIAPCRYTGSLYTDDLVLMAHNYEKHFGRISKLRTGDALIFTDMDGEAVAFEVVALDILHPTAIEEMTAGEYDLTLFTCTYGGKSRVTLRCMRTEVEKAP